MHIALWHWKIIQSDKIKAYITSIILLFFTLDTPNRKGALGIRVFPGH